LTPDVKEKFTEKLGENPRDFFGHRITAEELVKLSTVAKQWTFE
jgi:hypothetical protein